MRIQCTGSDRRSLPLRARARVQSHKKAATIIRLRRPSCAAPHQTPPSPTSAPRLSHTPRSFLEFVAALLKRLSADPKEELTAAAAAAYRETLYPFHGYLSSGVFQARTLPRTRRSRIPRRSRSRKRRWPHSSPHRGCLAFARDAPRRDFPGNERRRW